tara:strand:- start:350 stop:652 length:303 start_codon:yes stop_codon:yes gene_type:complete
MTPSPEENRLRWIRDLGACLQWHKEKAIKTKPVIIGGAPTDENILHNVFYNAILDALILVENLPLVKEEDEVEVVVDTTKGKVKNITNEVKEEDEDTSNS